MPVVLLCHCDGTNGSASFTDTSPSAHTLTATSATVTTTSPKFGTGSADLSSTTASHIDTGNAADFNLGSGQFTIEAWVYFTAAPSGLSGIVTQWAFPGYAWFLGMTASNHIDFYYSSTGGSSTGNIGGVFTPTLSTWYHIAVDRDASNMQRLYVNGAVIASGTFSSSFFASTVNCIIGNDSDGGSYTVHFTGHIDEIRITNGFALYGGAFTPPSAPFPDPVPNTTWNPSDKSTNLTLSGGNLVATASSSPVGVRATTGQLSGQYYFEVTLTSSAIVQSIVGVANASASLSNASSTPTGTVSISPQSGNIFLGSTSTGISLGARANGNILGFAVDLTNTLFWVRVAPSGNWNNNAGFAPGGTGGINFAAVGGGGIPLYPIVSTQTTGPVWTADFGDSAFSGAVPSGYTAGWPAVVAGGGAAAVQARAMVLA